MQKKDSWGSSSSSLVHMRRHAATLVLGIHGAPHAADELDGNVAPRGKPLRLCGGQHRAQYVRHLVALAQPRLEHPTERGAVPAQLHRPRARRQPLSSPRVEDGGDTLHQLAYEVDGLAPESSRLGQPLVRVVCPKDEQQPDRGALQREPDGSHLSRRYQGVTGLLPAKYPTNFGQSRWRALSRPPREALQRRDLLWRTRKMVAHPTAAATHGTTARKIVERPHVVSVCTHRIAVGWPVYCSHVRCVKSRRKDGSWQEIPPRPRGESLRASDGEGRSSVLSALSESSARRNDSRSPRSRGSCGELSQAVAGGKAQRIGWHLERETKGRETNIEPLKKRKIKKEFTNHWE